MKEGWKVVKLGEVCEFQNGFAFKSNLFRETGSPIIRISNIQDGQLDISNVVFFSKEDYDVNFDKYRIFPNDILIAMSGGTTGKLGLNKSETIYYQNQRVGVIREDSKKLDHSYLYYYLQTKTEESLRIAAGAAQPNLSTNQINNYLIPLPSLSEQHRIVKKLDAAFEKIDAMKAKAEKNIENAKALFQQTLAEELEPKEGWVEKKLGEVGTLQRGGNFLKRDFIENGFPCIHYGQIHTKFDVTTYKHLTCIPHNMVREDKLASKGDLIIAITSEDVEASCKCTAWMGNYDVAIGAHTAIFKHQLNPIYVSYYFKTRKFFKEKEKYAHGFKVVEIKPIDIAKIPIVYPPLPEQQQIVTKLDILSAKCKKLEEAERKTIAECDALKQAILRQAFNGDL